MRIPGIIFQEGRYFEGFNYILPVEELAGLTPAEREQVIADFRRDVAYLESAKTPKEQLERAGKKFKLPEAPPEAKIANPAGGPYFEEDNDGKKRRVDISTPDTASKIDDKENEKQLSLDQGIRDDFRELVTHVHQRRKARWIKKPPQLGSGSSEHPFRTSEGYDLA